jgi:CheY-like chemotaxis protein
MTFDPSSRVLVIEPDLLTFRQIKRALVALDVRAIDSTEIAAKGIGMARKTPYGLIICDYFMSPMNGYDVMREMKKVPETACIPFILTATQEFDLALTARARNLLRTLAIRPINAETLRLRVAQACEMAARAA